MENSDNAEQNDEIKNEYVFVVKHKYTFKYRMIKTILLIMAWMSFGLNNELVGPTYEDLKILMGINDKEISLALTLKFFGYLLTVPLSGFLLDKYSKHADILMAICCFFYSIPNLFIPWQQSYLFNTILFIIQGVFSACHDIGGNHIILSLWQGISNSPINAMHSGYGIGMILAIQLSNPFIKFNPIESALKKQSNESLSTPFNTTSHTTPSMINLKTPYFLSAGLGILLCILFLIAQTFENKNTTHFEKTHGVQLKLINEKAKKDNAPLEKKSFFDNLFFSSTSVNRKLKNYMLIQICLIFIAQFCIQGHFTIVSKFMLPYLTKGPGKFTLTEYSNISTLFWAFFVVSRFLSAFLAFKISSITFVFFLFIANLLVSSIFLVPYFTLYKLVFWIGMSLMGVASGPCTPSTFMVAKDLLKNYNSFVMSLFSVGMGLGSMFFQQTTGILLDSIEPRENFLGFENFNSSYIISYVFFVPCVITFLVYVVSYLCYKKNYSLLK